MTDSERRTHVQEVCSEVLLGASHVCTAVASLRELSATSEARLKLAFATVESLVFAAKQAAACCWSPLGAQAPNAKLERFFSNAELSEIRFGNGNDELNTFVTQSVAGCESLICTSMLDIGFVGAIESLSVMDPQLSLMIESGSAEEAEGIARSHLHGELCLSPEFLYRLG